MRACCSAKGRGWALRAPRAGFGSGWQPYPEVLVSCQNVDPSRVRVGDLLEAKGRPSVPRIHEDLAERRVLLQDGHRAALLRAFVFDSSRFWSAHTPSGVPPDVFAFFNKLHDKDSGPSEVLVREMFQIASYYRCLSTVDMILDASFESFQYCQSTRELLLGALRLCEDMGRDDAYRRLEPWHRATGFVRKAHAHSFRIDSATVRAYLAAAGRSGEQRVIEDAVSTLLAIPALHPYLRSTGHLYEAWLRACVGLDRSAAFAEADAIFGQMDELRVKKTLGHYAALLDLCTAHGDRERGSRVIDAALSVSVRNEEEGYAHEAATLNYYSRFGCVEEADEAISTADSDGKLQRVPVIVEAALRHFGRVALDDDASARSLVGRTACIEAAHAQNGTWPSIRLAALEVYAAAGCVPKAEAIFDELYQIDRVRLVPRAHRARLRRLGLLAYRRAAQLSADWLRLHHPI
ncbi:hypothetical protein DIPPA_04953 [Diplonema papillatum]|nr:hypothetical protein DIPPA_04953 [Diplonema papillatum]